MSFFDKLEGIGKNLGILEEVEDPKGQKSVPTITPAVAQNQATVPVAPVTAQVVPPVVVLTSDDSEYSAILQESLKSVSTGGMDFYKFLLSVEALSKSIPDEASRYSTAFAVAAASSNITVDSLLMSAPLFMNKLGDEKNEFQREFVGSLDADALKINEEITTISTEMDSIAAQIVALTEKQNTLAANRLSKNNELTSIKEKIEVETRNFDSASYKAEVKLKNHQANIEKYLKLKGE